MLDDSTVSLDLDGTNETLQCTIEAIQIMSKPYGGLWPLYERVKNLDIEAATITVRAGLMVDGDKARALPERVFRSGVVNVAPTLCEFILLCANGGLRPKIESGDDDTPDDTPEKPQASTSS